MDFNAHMRSAAYLDKSADMRMMYFATHAFRLAEFARLQLVLAMMRNEFDYFPEIACSLQPPWPWPGCPRTPAA